MARKFEVSFHRSRDQLYLDLIGDFDDVAAHELIDVLEDNRKNTAIAFIYTQGLEHVYPSGRTAFFRDLPVLRDFCYRLVFTGGNASQLTPVWTKYF